MHIAAFITVVAIVVGFAAPTCANDRPSDPFGNQTIELNKETPLVEMWESLRVCPKTSVRITKLSEHEPD
jgi:hypothetical protein